MSRPFAIIVADSHYDKNNVSEVSAVMDQAIDLAIERKINTIFHIGDVFTDRTGQGLMVLLAFSRWLQKCSANGIKVHAIPGNHDKTNQESEESYLDIYEGKYGFKLHRTGKYIFHSPDVLCCFLPYFPEGGSYLSRLEELWSKVVKVDGQKAQNRFLFTHIAIDGVKNNDGSLVTNNLKPKLFSKFTKVFVGHYHNRSNIGRIHYVGSIRPKDFGEDNRKGFTILNKDGSHEHVDAKFRKFIKVKVDLTEEEIDFDGLLSQYNTDEDNIRVVITGTEDQLALVPSKTFSDVGIDLKKESVKALKNMEAAVGSDFVRFDKAAITKAFVKFCKSNDMPKDQIAVGLKYIRKIDV